MFPWIYEHILGVILLSPLVGILILLIVPRKYEEASSEVALASTSLTLFLSLIMFGLFKGRSGFAFSESFSWLPSFGASFSVAVDGLSAILLVTTAFLIFFAVIINWKSVKFLQKEAYAALLIFEIGLIGLFSATDVLLMYIFMEVGVVFLGLTILFFTGAHEKFLQRYLGFMAFSSLIILSVIIFFFLGANSFSLEAVQQLTISEGIGVWILALLLIGTSIRMGLFPFNSWLSDLDESWIGFILIPVGLLFIGSGYQLYRFLPPLAMVENLIHTPLTWIIASSIIITALISTAQKNFGSLILYILRVHFGFVLLGIVSLNPQGFTGSGMQMISSAVSVAALSAFFIFFKRRNIDLADESLRGIFKGSPVLGLAFLIVLFSLAGLPGLAHFPGLFMIWMGLFKGSWVLTLVSLLGIVFITVQLVRFLGLALYKGGEEERQPIKLPGSQVVIIVLLALIILGIGIFPDIFLENIKQSTEAAWKVFSRQI